MLVIRRLLLVAVLLSLLACTAWQLPKCKPGTARVFCAIDLYTATLRAPGGPPPTCIDSKTQITITWCARVEPGMDMDTVNKLLTIIAKTWPQDMFSWSQNGGLFAGPHVTRPPSPPCEFTDANPWPETSPLDIDRGPGVVPQTASGGGGGPSLPTCAGTMQATDGGTACGPAAEGSPCATAADCSTCFCLPTSTGPQCELP